MEETLCAVLQKFSSDDYGYEEEEYQDIPSKTFCLTNAKKFRKGPLCFEKILASKILMDKRWGEGWCVMILRQIFFVSQCGNVSKGSLLVFPQFWVSRNFKDKKGWTGITTFRSNCFVSQYRNNS